MFAGTQMIKSKIDIVIWVSCTGGAWSSQWLGTTLMKSGFDCWRKSRSVSDPFELLELYIWYIVNRIVTVQMKYSIKFLSFAQNHFT